MCLIALNWDPDSDHPLIMLSNRDEFYQRPTRKAHFWDKHPDIFGGLDLRAGGTWLAVSTKGRLAAITNFRELDTSGERSRGELTSGFLNTDVTAEVFLKQVHTRNKQYAGFNLLLGDNTGLWYYSNRENIIRQLKPGLYGLSNGLLNTPWPKVRRLKKHLKQAISNHEINPKHLIKLLHDEHRPPDDQIPDTGVDPIWERMLSPCFIHSPAYGTRNSVALILKRDGSINWHEQQYDVEGELEQAFHERLSMPERWLTNTKTVLS
ncbi:NRDE family protein [Parendozoicomonas sp. Alg238-R29]|uniref:NRDE family protein n=1 Tax=Parendozoicomonas sp. Alg238-R29 TaxID=2993446 RepID=UPI00248D5DB5|nr:NRDE family protein [Parendozoicomonas sp. Alg238-R29]